VYGEGTFSFTVMVSMDTRNTTATVVIEVRLMDSSAS
jgi:hypothetical protein